MNSSFPPAIIYLATDAVSFFPMLASYSCISLQEIPNLTVRKKRKKKMSIKCFTCCKTKKSTTSFMSWYFIVKESPTGLHVSGSIMANLRTTSLGGLISTFRFTILTKQYSGTDFFLRNCTSRKLI